MNDEIIGTAVLAEMEPGKEMLFILQYSPSRKYLSHSAIPVCEVGKTHEWENGKPVWDYRVEGNCLNVTPSVHAKSSWEPDAATLFHNGGQWTIPFVRRAGIDASDSVFEINRDLRDNIRRSWEEAV